MVEQQKFPTPEERTKYYEDLICCICERTGKDTAIVRHHIKYFPEEKTVWLCVNCHRWLHVLVRGRVGRLSNANFAILPESLRSELDKLGGGLRKQKRVGGAASKYVGVTRQRNQWESRIRINRRCIALGLYDNQEDAARAYDMAARFYRGKLARTNFPIKTEVI